MKQVISEMFDRTLEILQQDRELMHRSANALLARDTLDKIPLKTLANRLIRPDANVRRDTANVADDSSAGTAQ